MTTPDQTGNRLTLPYQRPAAAEENAQNVQALQRWSDTFVVNKILAGTGITISSRPLATGPGAPGSGIVTIDATAASRPEMFVGFNTSQFPFNIGAVVPYSDPDLGGELQATWPPIAMAAGNVFEEVTFTAGPGFVSPPHSFTITFVVAVWDLTNTNVIVVGAAGVVMSGLSSLIPGPLSVLDSKGSDLSLVNSPVPAPSVHTAAGGTYSAQLSVGLDYS